MLRKLKIPSIELKKLIEKDNEDDTISIIYAIDDIDDEREAIELIKKTKEKYFEKYTEEYLHDFVLNTQYEGRKWFTKDGINIYQNDATTEHNTVISNNPMNTSFEKVYWVLLKKINNI